MTCICSRDLCSACWACREVCPKGCIDIEYDELAVPYPLIDNSRCIDCGLCKKICPNNSEVTFRFPKKVYAAWSKDADIRSTSASGGIATELYQLFLKDGGVAAGVVLNGECDAKYVVLDRHSDLSSVRNSKYTYSDSDGIYTKLRAYLDAGIDVLFIGLPCQVAALLKFLRKTYSNLTTVDIICHGVAPAEYLKQHVRHIESEQNKSASRCLFRDPRYKTHQFIFSLYDKDGRCFYHKRVASNDLYQLGYHKALIYRENCYRCKYARNERCSDLTIGDFSGLGRLEQCDFNNINVSCLMANTLKGEQVVELLSSTVELYSRPVREALDYERQLNAPSSRHPNREGFKSLFKQTGNFVASAGETLKQEIRNSDLPPDFLKVAFRSFIGSILPERVKRFIKKIRGNGK